LYPSRAAAPVGPPMIRFVWKMERQALEFQEEYLKPVDEEPPFMPNEMETFVRQLPRDTEIVALFKRISDECMIARPGPAIAPQG
jgi:hypothetical protein